MTLCRGERMETRAETTAVTFRPLTQDEIWGYIDPNLLQELFSSGGLGGQNDSRHSFSFRRCAPASLSFLICGPGGRVCFFFSGPMSVGLHNYRREDYVVEPGDRIAQLVIVPVLHPEIEVVEALPETVRGAGGFGSTLSEMILICNFIITSFVTVLFHASIKKTPRVVLRRVSRLAPVKPDDPRAFLRRLSGIEHIQQPLPGPMPGLGAGKRGALLRAAL